MKIILPLLFVLLSNSLAFVLDDQTLYQINPTIYETISLLEVFWLCVNIPGAILAWSNRRETNADLQAVLEPDPKGAPVDPRDELTARSNRRVDTVLVIVQVAFTLAGVGAMFAAPNTNTESTRITTWIVIGVFVAGSLLLTWLSWTLRQDRKKLLAMRPAYGDLRLCSSNDVNCYFREQRQSLDKKGKE